MSGHAQRSHAKYSGSNAARFFVCTAQPDLVARSGLIRRDTKYSLEGTKAHEILQTCLTTGAAPETIAPTPDMASAVLVTLDYVAAVQHEFPDLVVVVEAFLRFPQSVIDPDDAGGSPDVILWSAAARIAWIIDFKYGQGVLVEAKRNLQLWWYAASFCHDKPVLEARLQVIQPRSPSGDPIPDAEIITAFDINQFIGDVDTVLRAPKRMVAGAHCHWCPMAATCEAREAYALEQAREWLTFNTAGEIDAPDPLPAAADDRARAARMLEIYYDRVKPYFAALEEFVYSETRAGNYVPGWKLVEAQARRRWLGDVEGIAAELMSLSGYQLALDDVAPRKLMTITEATERLGAIAAAEAARGTKAAQRALIKERLAYLTSRESSRTLTLVRESDGRPATSVAAQMFAGVSMPPAVSPVHPTAPVLAAIAPPPAPSPEQPRVDSAERFASISDDDRAAWEALKQQQQGYYIDAR